MRKDEKDENPERERRVSIDANLQRQASNGIYMMARLLNTAQHTEEFTEDNDGRHASHWAKAGGAAMRSEAGHVAKRMRDAAKLKELQRQAFPLVLHRIKHLLDKVHKMRALAARSASRSSSPSWNKRGANDSPDFIRRLGGTSPEPMFHHPISSDGSQTRHPHHLHFRPDSTTPEPIFHDLAEEGYVTSGGMHSGPASPSIHTLEEMVEELNITFSFVSDFLRRLPDAVRSSLTFHAHIENYKKDQDVYTIGDEPDRFFVILSGQVEVWTHPPGKRRHKTHLDTLRKGHSFGDLALLNNELRSECCTPSCNCTFLTIDRRTFLNVLSPYFQNKLAADISFFQSNSEIFSTVSFEDTKNVINKMMVTTYKCGKEWEPMQEQQIYFIKSGTCILESHDHKSVTQTVTRSMLGGIGGDAPALAEEGTLANVVIGEDGRAIGTLGHEEEIKRLRRALIPKKVLSVLGPGAVFGGGPTVMGEGEAQSTLKVLAQSDVEVFHMHVGLFIRHASDSDLLRVLRDDFSFKLTYYLGRKGEIGSHVVVGHEEALLQCTARDIYGEDRNPALAAALASNPAAGLRNLSLHSPLHSPNKKKKAVKHVHEPGKFSPDVNRALAHIQALKDGHFAGDVDVQKHYFHLEQQGVTSSETFWCSSHANVTNRSLTIPPLLNQIFPEGLKPLGDKVEELVVRTARKTEQVIATTASIASSPKSPSKRFSQTPASEVAGLENASQRLERMLRLSQITTSTPNSPMTPSSRRQSQHQSQHQRQVDKWSSFSQDEDAAQKGLSSRLSRLSIAVPSSPFSDFSTFDSSRHLHSASATNGLKYGRSQTEDYHPSATTPGSLGSPKGGRAVSARTRGTALTAAGIIWDKQQPNAGTPLQRQCLTYEEMCALRRKAENDAAMEAETAKRAAMMASISGPSIPRKSSMTASSGALNSPAGSLLTRTPSVRTSSSPLRRYDPEISRLSSKSSFALPGHLSTIMSAAHFAAEAS